MASDRWSVIRTRLCLLTTDHRSLTTVHEELSSYILSYDGTDFNGWQTQPGYRTVQETLELAIATGHRRAAVASTPAAAPTRAFTPSARWSISQRHAADCPTTLLRAINAHLPRGRGRHARPPKCRRSFDANRDAVRKLYRYVIHDGAVSGPVPAAVLLPAQAAPRCGGDGAGRQSARSAGTTSTASRRSGPIAHSSVRTITHLAVKPRGRVDLD